MTTDCPYEDQVITEIGDSIRSLIRAAREDGLHYATPEQRAEFSFGVDGEFMLYVNGLDGYRKEIPPLTAYVTDQTGKVVYVDRDPVGGLIETYCPQTFIEGEGLVFTPGTDDFPLQENEEERILGAIKHLSRAERKLRDYLSRRRKANP